MTRIIAVGLAALLFTACKPANETPQSEASMPTATASAHQSSAPVSWEATKERYLQVEAVPSDPLEALEWRAVQCDHYSSEFGGEGSERDRWLNARMDKLQCGEELTAEARSMRDGRSTEPTVAARLNALLQAFEQ